MLQLQTLRTTAAASPSFPPLPRPRRPRMLPLASATAADVTPTTSASAANRRSLYEVLRVKRNASQVEIKTAYRTLAKLYHPDATSRFMDSTSTVSASSSSSSSPSSDGRDFIEIHNAYATLSDPDARAVYDFKLTVDSQRRWGNDVGVASGYRSSGRGRFYPTRRWETDQCW